MGNALDRNMVAGSRALPLPVASITLMARAFQVIRHRTIVNKSIIIIIALFLL
jgi:hypothetical protein